MAFLIGGDSIFLNLRYSNQRTRPVPITEDRHQPIHLTKDCILAKQNRFVVVSQSWMNSDINTEFVQNTVYTKTESVCDFKRSASWRLESTQGKPSPVSHRNAEHWLSQFPRTIQAVWSCCKDNSRRRRLWITGGILAIHHRRRGLDSWTTVHTG